MVTLLLTLLSSSLVQAAGFSAGNEFTATYLSGEVNVSCSGNRPSNRLVRCETEILDPAEFDYFTFDEPTTATSVTLSNFHDGKTYSATKKFNSKKGRSSLRFNLWVYSLTQRALLGYGQNKISYQLTQNKQSVGSGEFDVIVNQAQPRRCPYRHMWSTNPADCDFGSTLACSRYFSMENYCTSKNSR